MRVTRSKDKEARKAASAFSQAARALSFLAAARGLRWHFQGSLGGRHFAHRILQLMICVDLRLRCFIKSIRNGFRRGVFGFLPYLKICRLLILCLCIRP